MVAGQVPRCRAHTCSCAPAIWCRAGQGSEIDSHPWLLQNDRNDVRRGSYAALVREYDVLDFRARRRRAKSAEGARPNATFFLDSVDSSAWAWASEAKVIKASENRRI